MADRNPWSAQFWDPAAQGAYIAEKGIARANIRAREGGSSVGGPRPPLPPRVSALPIQAKPLTPQQRFNGNGVNPWSSEGWSITAQSVFYKQYGVVAAQAEAAKAGTTLGGPRPLGNSSTSRPRVFVLNKTVVNQVSGGGPTERDLVIDMGLGIGAAAQAGVETYLDADMGFGFAHASDVEIAQEIASAFDLGIGADPEVDASTLLLTAAAGLGANMAPTPTVDRIVDLHAAMSLGMTQGSPVSTDLTIAAAMSFGFLEAAAPTVTQYIQAAMGLGYGEAASIDQTLAAAMGLGVSEAAAIDRSVSISASPGLGISDATALTKELSLSASAALGVSEAAAVQAAAPFSALVKTYRGTAAINNQSFQPFSFTGKAIGTASADRWVVVLIAAKNQSTDSLTGVTIGGVTAQVETISGALNVNQGECFIATANVPTGTTADIVVTFAAGFTQVNTFGVGIDWYTVVGAFNHTATDSFDFNAATNPSHAFTVPAGGVAFVIGIPPTHGTQGSDFNTDDNFVQFVNGPARYAGSAANGTSSPVTATFSTSGWTSGSTTMPVCGRAYGM